jgi:tryptophanyl-tRNA synthetase
VIRMIDPPDVIRRKIRRAVTDSDGAMHYDPTSKPGLSNLADILAAITSQSPQAVIDAHSRYGDLKDACIDAVIDALDPVRRRHDEFMNDPGGLACLLHQGADRARSVADPVLHRARQAMGIMSDTLNPRIG